MSDTASSWLTRREILFFSLSATSWDPATMLVETQAQADHVQVF